LGKGTIDQRYQLKETSTKNYPQRTEKNVRNSDGTVIFTISPNITGGAKKTAELAAKHDKLWIHLHRGRYEEPERLLRQVSFLAADSSDRHPSKSKFIQRSLT